MSCSYICTPWSSPWLRLPKLEIRIHLNIPHCQENRYIFFKIEELYIIDWITCRIFRSWQFNLEYIFHLYIYIYIYIYFIEHNRNFSTYFVVNPFKLYIFLLIQEYALLFCFKIYTENKITKSNTFRTIISSR